MSTAPMPTAPPLTAPMLTENDIRRSVPASTFAAAQYYARQGRVKAVKPLSATLIEAQVVGSAKSPYEQRITLKPRKAGIAIDGACTCFVGHNCKHVAAALLMHLEDPQQLPPAAAPRPAATQVGTKATGKTGSKAGSKAGAQASSKAGANAEPDAVALPREVATWLDAVEAAQAPETESYPANIRRRLYYVLTLSTVGEAQIALQPIQLNANGTISSAGRAQPAHAYAGLAAPPAYFRPSDLSIIRRLIGFGSRTPEHLAVLRDVVATGRARLDSWSGLKLHEAGTIPATLAWTTLANGQQRPAVQLPKPLRSVALAQPWYLDPQSGGVGPVDTGLSERLAAVVLASPSLPPALAERVRAELEKRSPAVALHPPRAHGPSKAQHEPMQPVLTLHQAELPGGRGDEPAARLEFRYGAMRLLHTDSSRTVNHEGRVIDLARDLPAERMARQALNELGLATIDSLFRAYHPQGADFVREAEYGFSWAELVQHELPRLEKTGWLIVTEAAFPVRIVRPDSDVWANVRESTGFDWLELEMGVMVDGQRVDLIPAIIQMIAKGSDLDADPSDAPDILVPLPDGRHLILPRSRLEPMVEPLLDLFADGKMEEGGRLRVGRHEAAGLAALEYASAGIVWSGGDAVRALGRQLRDQVGIPPVVAPAALKATLRGYQLQGVAWLQFLRAAGLGGVLADDMGLGKTLQALTHLVMEQEQGRLDRPALVICPTSLVANWASEAARFAPTLRTLTLHGPDRASRFGQIAHHNLVITTYPLLARDHMTLGAQDWHVVLLDEAQIIKNPAATTSKIARTLRADQRLCLSGTPLENHLGELWSLFDFLMPGFLGDRKGFGTRYRVPIEKAGDAETQAALARRVGPFLLRRTKSQVAADLPPKTEIPELVQMESPQRAVYESIRLAMHAKIREAIAERGMARSGIVILDALLKLRQVCCDPRLLPSRPGPDGAPRPVKESKARSAKLDRLMEMLPTLLEEGRRILLFSQFTSMLSLIEAELREARLPYVILTGETKDRATPIRQFQNQEVPLFLISLKAGGVGLNLTAADTVIHFDPWWNPAVENQATDRAHRIGQDKKVFVHRLITEQTIEQKMEVLKSRKQALADGILSNTADTMTTLTEQDLENLFAPAC